MKLVNPSCYLPTAFLNTFVGILTKLWARLDSNQGPTDYESAALTRLSYRPKPYGKTPHGKTRASSMSLLRTEESIGLVM